LIGQHRLFHGEKDRIQLLELAIFLFQDLATGAGRNIFEAGPQMASEGHFGEAKRRARDRKDGQEDDFRAWLLVTAFTCHAMQVKSMQNHYRFNDSSSRAKPKNWFY
jgi:hypothetical protein